MNPITVFDRIGHSGMFDRCIPRMADVTYTCNHVFLA